VDFLLAKGDRSKWKKWDLRRRLVVVWMTRRGLIRITVISGLLLLMAVVFISEMPSARTWTYWTLPLSGKVIALDAGHGGPDGGAVSREGVIEKDLNLAIVLYLRDYLQQAGALERADRVQNRRVHLALSVHMNSIPSPKWSGAQTFYFSGNLKSVRLAADIQAEIRESLGNTSRAAKPNDTLYLLKTLKMPTALVEVGFLSHPEESRMLADEDYQKKVAAAIYRGILRYAASEDGRSL
jgi:N-acetylmuramoyl-L-alanine amidase